MLEGGFEQIGSMGARKGFTTSGQWFLGFVKAVEIIQTGLREVLRLVSALR